MNTPRARTSKRRVPMAAATTLLLLAACGGSTTAETTPPSTTPTTSQPPAPPMVEVKAIDYGYLGLPARVAAGTTLTLVNESEGEVHELVAIRLPDDEQRPVAELVQLPPEKLGAFFPLVETVLIAPPGETGFAVEGNGTLTEPGRYAVICVIPTGADPAEYLAAAAEAEGGPPQVDGGPPHIVNGMFGEITVDG